MEELAPCDVAFAKALDALTTREYPFELPEAPRADERRESGFLAAAAAARSAKKRRTRATAMR